MSNPFHPGLEGLLDLACRDGVDIRPTLLRVLTDLYVQKPVHTPQEERHYVELARRLIETVDAATRATVIARLRTYPHVPAALRPYLTQGPVPQLPEPHRNTPAAPREPAAHISAQSGELPPMTSDSPSIVAPAAAEQPAPPTAAELCELFFQADSNERRLILLHLDAAATAAKAKTAPLAVVDETMRHLESVALRHDRNAFAREVMALFGLNRRHAQRIVDDASGEPILVAAKALGMPATMLQRVLLFLNPTVGQSVQRVYDLAALYEEMSVAAAHYMMSIFRKAAPPERPAHPAARLQPSLRPDEAPAAREVGARRVHATREREVAMTPRSPSPIRTGAR